MQNAFMSADQDMAKRLVWARETCGVHAIASNATEAARMLGMKPPTYLAHENGSRGFGPKNALRYATFYRVNIAWLLYGTGQARQAVA